MQVVKTKGQVGNDGWLRVDVPVELPAGTVELVLVVNESAQPDGSKYDFASAVGKLEWHGDAVEEQRRLRDEFGDDQQLRKLSAVKSSGTGLTG
jgi:hypothetical protein